MSAMQELQRLLKPATDENDSPVLQREYDRLKKIEALVHGARIEAIGWTHADACCDLDAGRDPRQKEVPEMLKRAEIDLGA